MEELLIVGGGPVGMSSALFLNHLGHSCHLIDNSKRATGLSKAILINPMTLQLFEEVNFTNKILNAGFKINGINFYREEHPISHISFDTLPSKYRFAIGLPQSQTEALLSDELESRGIKIERECEFLDFVEMDHEMLVTIRKKGLKNQIKAEYLVGADGGHSQVRESAGIDFPGEHFPVTFHGFDVRIKTSLPEDQIHVFLLESQAAILIPFEKNLFRLITTVEMLNEIKIPQVEIQEELWKTEFHISSHLADTFQKGHIFLMGDAAHIHSPIGARGMNNGFLDAYSFANHYHDHTLEQYTKERRAACKKIVHETKLFTKLMISQNPLMIFFRRHMIPLLLKSKTLSSTIMTRNMGLN